MDQQMRDFEERLENWAFVVREGLILNHCASAEHRYRGERDADRRAPQQVVDIPDGWLVEQAWRLLPDRYRWLLKLHYVRNMARSGVIKWVLKRTGHAIKSWNFESERLHAMRSLKKLLDMPAVDLENARQQFESLFESKSARAQSGALARPEETKAAQVRPRRLFRHA